jgi:hypothetical protein
MNIQLYVLTAFCIFGGLYFLIRNIKYLKNEDDFKAYLSTSPKGKAWVSKYGMEKTIELSKKYFLPLGCLISLLLLGVGVRNIIIMLQS